MKDRRQKKGKRFFDLLVTLPVLILLAPLLACIAIFVKAKLGPPVLFKQKRPGLNGAPFTLYKFRTMTNSRDAQGRLLTDAQRLIPLGLFLRSTSLDELPEFINVLKGDMSLVGPRPLLTEYLPLYNSFQYRRHEVRPGITGWAQVVGRNAISWDEKFKLDVWYVDNQSFKLDLKIIVITIWKALIREGINQPGQATMEKFKGNSAGNIYHE